MNFCFYINYFVQGDLTDAKNSDYFGSRQYESEWITYEKILKENTILNDTIWLDIRGNHGNLTRKLQRPFLALKIHKFFSYFK